MQTIEQFLNQTPRTSFFDRDAPVGNLIDPTSDPSEDVLQILTEELDISFEEEPNILTSHDYSSHILA